MTIITIAIIIIIIYNAFILCISSNSVLVSFFDGISTFVGYLMLERFLVLF